MNYNNFDNAEVVTPVELHKTDYNNYQGLSNFVKEYYKAQALITALNNFYSSFLKTKHIPYSTITNSAYSWDKYKFFCYTLKDCNNSFIKYYN